MYGKSFIPLMVILFAHASECLYLKSNQNKNNYKDCPDPYSHCSLGKEGYINVHLAPHTHDDTGWLKTIDQYYYGSNLINQQATVQYILDTVIRTLDKDPTKRFVYVEMAFFWRWWKQQNDDTKTLVRKLLDQKRLEFVIGGWCMNDEATTYYRDIIDQQTLGLEFILKEFGECVRPRAATQLDPFGHSKEQASLFAQFGFDGVFFGRIDYQDFEHRANTKSREMLWQASDDLGVEAQLFTGILPNLYKPPPGFCFDNLNGYCADDALVDNPESDEYNIDVKMDFLYNYTLDQASKYKTTNLIFTFGADFRYHNPITWFKNMDKVIYHLNKRQENGSKINIFYSTIGCYLYSLNKANVTWPVKNDDFFPYAHRAHSFWTGYFTSRSALKIFTRRAANILQSVRHIVLFSSTQNQTVSESIRILERAVGVLQHHDGVSGTEKQHVAFDYSKRLSRGLNAVEQVIRNLLKSISSKISGSYLKQDLPLQFCTLVNISECQTIQNSTIFAVFLYNPLPIKTSNWIQVPVENSSYAVVDYYRQQLIPSETHPVYQETKNIPERNSSANYNLVFKVDLLPLSFKYYLVSLHDRETTKPDTKPIRQDETIIFKNNYLQVTFDENGNLNKIDNLETNISTPISQVFCFYESIEGNNSQADLQASGAYIFRPKSDNPSCFNVKNFTVYQGKLYSEIHQIYNEWMSQTVRLYTDTRDVQFEWQVGPIDISNNIGKEVITKFSTNINSKSTFYTDSNGRQIIKRVRDFRPTWNLNQTEKSSGNYYPINSIVFIRDEDKIERSPQLNIVNDRSQGAASLQDGSIEIMLHRRLLHDDSLGVVEPLNEKGLDGNGLICKGILNLIFDIKENSPKLFRPMILQINNQPLDLFVSDSSNFDFNSKEYLNFVDNLNYLRPLKDIEFPPNLHLLSLFQDYDNLSLDSFVIRIEHFYEKGEDPVLSQPASIDLQQIFDGIFDIVGVKELALGANINVEDLNQRLKWNAQQNEKTDRSSESNKKTESDSINSKYQDSFTFTFQPMQIRTFRVNFKRLN